MLRMKPATLYNLHRVAFCVLFFVSITTFGQQYNFKNYSVENGLPYVQIFTMFQDSKGYLWSGGYGGLSKFNGKTFKNYSPKNGLANHYVNAITEFKPGLISVGTINGLSMIDGASNQIKNFYIKDGLPSNNVTAFCNDPRIGLCIGTKNGLCIWNGKKIIQVPFFKNIGVTCLLFSLKNGVMVGTNKGLYKQIKNTLMYYAVIDTVNVTCTAEDKKGKIYTGTHDGLYVADIFKNTIGVFHINNGLIDEDITSLISDQNGVVWIGSQTGLVSFDEKEFSYYNIGLDNNSNHISSLLIDYEKNLWIGTHSGLYKYRGKGFTVYDRKNGLGGAFIYQIIRDNKQNLWIGTEANGVYKFSDGFFKNYSVSQGLSGNRVPAILPLNDGSIWFGTDKGISILNNNVFSDLNTQKNFKLRESVFCLFKDSKNTIWAGGKNGLCSIKKKGAFFDITNYALGSTIIDKGGCEVWSILEDASGAIWAGTYQIGLFKLEGKKFKRQAISSPEPVSTAFDMCADNIGNIYAATLNGVLVFNPQKHSYNFISEKDGLSSELVYTIGLTRDKKFLWAGTNQGINRIDIDKLNNNITDIKSYGKTDGFTGVESNSHGIYEDTDSSIWFGTVNGLIKYTPGEFYVNNNLSKTTITNIKLSFKDTLLNSGVVLPYSLNNISFEFDGISLTNPDKVLYSYKLEGFDKTWSPPTDINFVKYDNLTPGKYTFNVKSCNNDGIWNIEGVQFKLQLKPPFYKTWWFTIGILIFTCAIIVGIFRLRLNQLNKKQKEKAQQDVEISKAELKALRAQMNPHFVFNSLNSIQHYILNSKSEEAAKYLNKFAKLIRLILNNSDKPMVTINEDLEALILYLELEKMRFDNKFTYSIKIHEEVDGDYDEIPPMLVQPYIENAILHGINPKTGTGHITIEICIINQFIKISIIDDGIGREKSKSVLSIQLVNKHRSLGMKITKDRLRILNTIHQSNLSVNVTDLYDTNKNSKGTRVDLFIPYIK